MKKPPPPPPKKKSDFKDFLKRRAPIYLGITGLFLIFVLPGLTRGTLEGSLPDDLDESDQRILDVMLSYDGANDKGITLLEVLKEHISSDFGDEIYDHPETAVNLDVGAPDADGFSEIRLEVLTHKGDTEYTWRVNPVTEQVQHSNDIAKYILELVDYSD